MPRAKEILTRTILGSRATGSSALGWTNFSVAQPQISHYLTQDIQAPPKRHQSTI